jgi:3-deoxy-D-manno-octulosonate 8-phosphate phosphatase (KDO 8-P phosphatase)
VERAARIKLMIFDVDGVLTDGSLHYGADGEALKTFNVQDGLGIKLIQEAGIDTAIISARKSPQVIKRAADLGINHLHQGGHDKLTPFNALLEKTGLTAEQVGFIGDDVVDLPILTRVGLRWPCRTAARKYWNARTTSPWPMAAAARCAKCASC